MTNIIQWNDNVVCMSDGYLWALESTKWTAASICNTRNEVWFRIILLVMINGTMELFRPSKEACTYNHDMPPIRSVETATHCTSLTIPTPQCKPLNPAKYSQWVSLLEFFVIIILSKSIHDHQEMLYHSSASSEMWNSRKFIPMKCCTIPDVDAPVESQAISTASTTDDSE